MYSGRVELPHSMFHSVLRRTRHALDSTLRLAKETHGEENKVKLLMHVIVLGMYLNEKHILLLFSKGNTQKKELD